MCCNQCDYYSGCEDLGQQDALCCGRCSELEDCNGEQHAGQSILDDDFDDDDLDDDDFDDDDDTYDDEIFDVDDDDDDFDDEEEEDFPVSH